MENRIITLKLTLEDVNKMLTALGNLPYVQVFDLIKRIQDQAETQILEKAPSSNGTTSEKIKA